MTSTTRAALVWLAYGTLLALGLSLYASGVSWNPSIRDSIMPTRAFDLEATRVSHAAGLPLLVAEGALPGAPEVGSSESGGGAYRGISIGDDIGMNLLVAFLDRGSLDATISFIMVGAVALLLAVYPWLFWRAFGSRLLALLVPLALVPGAIFLWQPVYFDVYWAQAWIILLGVPWLAAIERQDASLTVAFELLLLAMLCGAASLVRNHAGLGVLLALLISCWGSRHWSRAVRLALAGMAVGAYVACVAGVANWVEARRGAGLAELGVVESRPYGHAIWHTAYIGLGWFDPEKVRKVPLGNRIAESGLARSLQSPCGVHYADEVGIARAREVDPSALYLSERYLRILRESYFDCVRRFPGHYVYSSSLKASASVALAVVLLLTGPWTLGVLLLAFAGAMIRRRIMGGGMPGLPEVRVRWQAVVVALTALAPMLIAVPSPRYAVGLATVLYVYGLMLLCSGFREQQVAGGVRAEGSPHQLPVRS